MRTDDQRFLELLQRWQSGDFNRQDEQTLRSLTDSDDFRREAMEGFMALPETDHSTHLAALRERLRVAAPPRSRVISMPQMMAVAAALLVLVAAIFFFPRVAEKQNDAVAQNSETAAPSPAAAPQMPEGDSEASDAIASQTLPQRELGKRSSATRAPEREAPIAYQAADAANDDKNIAAEESTMPPPVTESATMSMRPPITNDGDWPPGGRPGTFGKVKANEPAAPMVTKTKKPAAAPADTMGLAWNDTEKKSDLDKLRKEVRADQLGPAESEPAEGWTAFREYLRQNARLPADARDRNVSGNVLLQFTVNENGDPQNFVVLRSLGQSCDDEAKRLVQNWNWVRGQNPVVTVEVKFVR